MGYEYDVFVSYSHDSPFGEWVKDPFMQFLPGLLKAALNRSPKIFIDHDIQSGETWKNKLRKALGCSQCLIGIWSPNYFLSEWCKRECLVMLHRQTILDYGTVAKPGGLVVPISLHDGDEHFPQFAKDIQSAQWQEFALIGNGFKETVGFVEFQKSMVEWTKNVATAINNAPVWDEEWSKDHWFDYRFPEWVKKQGIDLSNKENTFNPPSLA
jgi:hypothetical protein